MNGLVSFAAMPVKCGAGPAATKEGALQCRFQNARLHDPH
jgi:hypothetical protein